MDGYRMIMTDKLLRSLESLELDQSLKAEKLIIQCFEVGFLPLDCENFVYFTGQALSYWLTSPSCEHLQLRAVIYARLLLDNCSEKLDSTLKLKTVVDTILAMDQPVYHFRYSPRKNFTEWLAFSAHGYYGQLRDNARARNQQRLLQSKTVA
jgi:hypothetical protein